MSAGEIIELLGLRPHPIEGGYFYRTYESEEWIPREALPTRYGSERRAGTAIYYLLTPETFSAMHRLASDEIFHFYLGDPVEMLQLHPDGTGCLAQLGTDLKAGMSPQVVVRRGVWQGSRLRPGGRVALLGTTVTPGFDYSDYRHGDRDELVAAYPRFRSYIESLTRNEGSQRRENT